MYLVLTEIDSVPENGKSSICDKNIQIYKEQQTRMTARNDMTKCFIPFIVRKEEKERVCELKEEEQGMGKGSEGGHFLI